MTTKSVDIQIAAEDFQTLKDNGYRLCFAKKVNGVYNVIWQSYDKYLENNTFSWTPTFQIFGTNTFESNIKVKVQTNTQNISLGEQVILDENGHVGDPATGGPSTSLTLIDQYGPIHPGVNQLSFGIDGQQHVSPIYVAEKQIVTGQTELTPKESVMVWFEQNVETSTMFSDSKSNSVEIDLTMENSASRAYQGGKWITPSNVAMGRGGVVMVGDGPGLLTVILVTTGAITAGLLAQKIGAYLTGVYQDIEVEVEPAENRKFKVTYKERPRLTTQRQRFVAALTGSPTTRNQLTMFALNALTDSKMSYDTFDASPKL